jgi:hypothetical protein
MIRELSLSGVDAIKLDVGGTDVPVLRRASRTLKRFHPKLTTA